MYEMKQSYFIANNTFEKVGRLNKKQYYDKLVFDDY